MKDEYDVIIVGAGPAGLSSAIELQKSNLSTLVLEKNEVIGPKVCAGGLTTKIEELGIPLNTAEILFSSILVSLPNKSRRIFRGGEPLIGTIDRGKLGQVLLGKLSENVTVKNGCSADEIGNDFVLVNGKKLKYKYLIGADGSNSIVRKHLGLKNNKFLIALQYLVPGKFDNLEFSISPDLFGPGYAWIFPHREYASVGCGRDVRFKNCPDLRKSFEEWLDEKGIKTEGAELQGWVINFDFQGFEFGNKFLVGDAGGFASGLTGEGIYFAMISGRDVARKILDSQYKCDGITAILKIKRRHEFILRLVSSIMQSSRPLSKILLRLFLRLLPSNQLTRLII